MANAYIIELFFWNVVSNKYEKEADCTMQLDSISGSFKITKLIDAQENKLDRGNNRNDGIDTIYVNANIKKDDIMILSKEVHNIASMYDTVLNSINYEMFYNGKKFGIRFDARSSAAEKNFYSEFSKTRETHYFSERYPSGNRKIEGTKLNRGYNGFCVEYYDRAHSPIKYIGDFEDGLYDGSGEFFSEDGNIRLICKNICSGKPNGFGKLIVGRKHYVTDIEMKSHSHLSSKDTKYTNNVLAENCPDYRDMLELIKFEALSIEERTIYLFREIRKLIPNNEQNGEKLNKIGTMFGRLF